jgi:glycosyltransferase involved in cell wall biosynthesis
MRRLVAEDLSPERSLERGPTGSSAPRFSVVVPAYNEAGYLGRTLASLQGQDYPGSYEIVVVDNNSEDETTALASSFGVRVVAEPRAGVCAARQRGVDTTNGEIIVSTDADTEHPSDWLRTIDAVFTSSPSVVAVAGPCRYEDAHGWTKYYPQVLFGLVGSIYRRTGWISYVSATNLAVRRSAFPGYDIRQTQGGDELDLLRRLRPVGSLVWDPANVVTTSARRLQRGFLYNFFVTFLVYYLLAYVVNRVAGRPRFGMAPAIRRDTLGDTRARRPRVLVPVVALATAATTLLVSQFRIAVSLAHLVIRPFH